MRTVFAFVAAVLTAFFLGAIALTAFDQMGYTGAGGVLTLVQRFIWLGQTTKGLLVDVGMYLPLITVGLIIAFLAAWAVKRTAPQLRFWWYAGAGAVAMIVMIFTLKAVLGLFVLPGARTLAGIAAQGLAGFCAGAVYARLSERRAA